MERIDGKELAARMKQQIREQTTALAAQGIVPKLALVAAGDDAASGVYAAGKEKDCAECGLVSESICLPANCTQEDVLRVIDRLNWDASVSGILVQLPLPAQVSTAAVLEAIRPEKDVDGFSPVNIGRMFVGEDCFLPCTPAGCIELLKAAGCQMAGKHAVVIGRSNIVGKPMAVLLLRENATVTVCHSKTADLAQIARTADILVAAVGRARFVTKEMVKPGAVVVDVGINRDSAGKLCGDVDEAALADLPGRITPVPGGVGVVTRAVLMRNTLAACMRQHDLR